MKKELGKWFMDIAKYMTTALLLSSVFAEMNNIYVILSVIVSVVLTLGVGLYLQRDKQKEIK